MGIGFLLALGACNSSDGQIAQTSYDVTVQRTQDGVPHISAADWSSLGYGVGYAQAQDSLCTLAESFVTWRGERAANFGADGTVSWPSSFGTPTNVDSDFFFRSVIDDGAVAQFRAEQPKRLKDLVAGYVDGYNRYADRLRAGDSPGAHAACTAAPWVTHITADDLYRRFIAVNLQNSLALYVRSVAQAQPPGAAQAAASLRRYAAWPAPGHGMTVKGKSGIGSNAMVFGAAATRNGPSMLFGNPHWYWEGPDRLYPMQLRIPHQLDVAGATFLGVPVIMLGFNENVAWTHTVSTAMRYGIFELSLVAGAPTRYRYDGNEEAMRAVPITIQVRDQTTGALAPLTRTLYRTRFGPVVDLSSLAPGLGWSTTHAYAFADVNLNNPGTISNFLDWNQATSLDDFISIQKRNAAAPWMNTLAIGRNNPNVWYADIGAVPGVTDALAAACTTETGRSVDATMPGLPFLDGSRGACNWTSFTLPGAVSAGRMPVNAMPSLERTDYAANFNDSYWLTNPKAPLTGFAQVLGPTGTVQSLRTRLGDQIGSQLMGASGGVQRTVLEQTVLGSTSMSAQLFLQPVIDSVCGTNTVAVAADPSQPDQTQAVNIEAACAALRQWDGTANANSRGANLWEDFWGWADWAGTLRYTKPFDAAHPLVTPDGLDTTNPAVVKGLAEALGRAVLDLTAYGIALDSPRGDVLYIKDGQARIPLYGGCDVQGYFTVTCSSNPLGPQGEPMDSNGFGNSYMQVVSFSADGPQADTMFTTGVSEDPASPWYRVSTRIYAQKTWTPFPFSSQALDSMPNVTKTVLTGTRTSQH
ncbi:penicillin acylase family protein [Caballeronia sp. LZ065]|uniref:penicillin acylase family protein n=1 Tax=Caballeronia sp. LZ065 TaxID=3038571 RepID=UPI00285EF00E|nr:penicillin acylase family protein [Caballeronia sp. LZ065]MDR5780857.1 penicillin acylase family protein [Caballeronia sp. LZ065]